jgi:hypothetical protein
MSRFQLIRPFVKGLKAPPFRWVHRHGLVAPPLSTALPSRIFSATIPRVYFQTRGLHPQARPRDGQESGEESKAKDEKNGDAELEILGTGVLWAIGLFVLIIIDPFGKEESSDGMRRMESKRLGIKVQDWELLSLQPKWILPADGSLPEEERGV